MAVNYLHKNMIVHRDIRAENLVFVNRITGDLRLKLIDFGTATKFDKDNYLTQAYGTPYYMAPEVAKGCYSEKADLWSIGVLLHIMLTGKPLFSGTNKEIIQQVIDYKMMTFDGHEYRRASSGAIDLLKKLTHTDPNQRPSAERLLDHVWIKSLGQMNVQISTVQKALLNF